MYLEVEIIYYYGAEKCRRKSEIVLFADSYEKAIHKLSAYYDKENIISISIKQVGEEGDPVLFANSDKKAIHKLSAYYVEEDRIGICVQPVDEKGDTVDDNYDNVKAD